MYWARGFVVQGLRGLNLTREDFEEEAGQVNQTTAHAIERLVGLLAEEAGLRVTDTERTSDTHIGVAEGSRPRARVIPFYLPQFHAVQENDLWWGPGFTEWTNVTAAKPVYRGHWQPKLPRDLGYYDLEDPMVLERHERMARDHGIDGFMFYHYWFSGRRILEAPLIGRIPRRDGLPFCVMWANENWTRRWDGQSQDVLLAQDYAEVPAERFATSILAELSHPDYLTVAGRRVLAVYRPAQIPDIASVLTEWRRVVRSEGLGELLVLAVDVPTAFDGLEGGWRACGFDGLMGFAPHNIPWTWRNSSDLGVSASFAGNIFSYAELVDAWVAAAGEAGGAGRFPGVMTGFDNTARRSLTPDLWYGSNPYTFRRWLAAAVDAVSDRPQDERVVFVNAWNEWAEGAMLEPSDKFGRAYLQAVRDVVT
jgi:hypothetical protein